MSYKPPVINVLTTASAIRAFQDYDPQVTFFQSDTIYVYLEYYDILINDLNECDLYLELNVSLDGTQYYTFNSSKTVVGNKSHAFWFITDVLWPGYSEYSIDVYLQDNLSMRAVGNSVNFYLF